MPHTLALQFPPIPTIIDLSESSRFAIQVIIIVFSALLLNGCATSSTYGTRLKQITPQINSGQRNEAINSIKNSHHCESRDALLCNLMIAVVEHRFSKFDASNKYLEQADRIAEELYTTRAINVAMEILTNPSMAPYRGTEYEWVYVSYLKALNYLNLASLATDAKAGDEQLRKARIEIRRVDIKLNDIQARKGDYKEALARQKGTEGQLLIAYRAMLGHWVNSEALTFRTDAYLRYLTGVIYEMLGELDNARIAYQKAAEVYETGYAKQYELGDGMTRQAWFDTIRIMRKRGGYANHWETLARRKLSPQQRSQLEADDSSSAQLIVIEHFDQEPASGELNLVMTANQAQKSLVLRPLPTGSIEDKRAQLLWFSMVYADKGILPLIYKYNRGGLASVARSPLEKTFFMGPLWDSLTKLKVPQALERFPLRVAIGYAYPLPKSVGSSQLFIQGKSAAKLKTADSIAQLSLQNQLRRSGLEIRTAVMRASMQTAACVQLLKEWGGLCSTVLARAETRSWLLLPYEIRLSRVPLRTGHNDVELVVNSPDQRVWDKKRKSFNLSAGQIAVWSVFTSGIPSTRRTTTPSSSPPFPVFQPTTEKGSNQKPTQDPMKRSIESIFKDIGEIIKKQNK